MSSLVTVTGASGHIGGYVVRALLAQGRRVRAVYHQDVKALEGLPVERVQADVTDANAIYKAIEGSDVVYHLAAVISLHDEDEQLMRRVNIDGVRNVMEACLKYKVRRVVHFSSIHAFRSTPGRVVDESTPFVQGNEAPIYDQTKAEGTRLVRAAIERGLDTVIIHPVGVIGPTDRKPSQIGGVILQIANRTLPALVAGGFNWVDVRDVATAAVNAETKGRSGEHYLIAGQWRPAVDIGKVIHQTVGVRPPRLVTPIWVARASLPFVSAFTRLTGVRSPYTHASLHALYNHLEISHAKAARELDHRPRPFEETVADTVTWFRDAGMIRQ